MQNFDIENPSSYTTLFDKLTESSAKKIQEYEASLFTKLPNEVIFNLFDYLDLRSLGSVAFSCKMLYMLLHNFVWNKVTSFNQKFSPVKKEYGCKNWAMALEKDNYIIEGSIELYDLQWSPDWADQIEDELSKNLVDCEITARCNSIAEGVQVEITIKLPDEFKFFTLEKISQALQLPISQASESDIIPEGSPSKRNPHSKTGCNLLN